MTVSFTVKGKPQGKGRPRMSNGHCYTPQTTRDYEEFVRLCYRKSGKVYFTAGMPIKVDIVAIFEIPKATSKINRVSMLIKKILPTKKVDIDNVIKIIFDALNGEAYCDDSQICDVHAIKVYGENPMVQVSIRDIDGENSP